MPRGSPVIGAFSGSLRCLMLFLEGCCGPCSRAETPCTDHATGAVLVVRWLDRISRRYDELHETMQRLMKKGVRVECTLNEMAFDGQETDATRKAIRDAILAFMAAQGEADYRNRREMQARGIAIAKQEGKYKGRKPAVSYEEVRAYHAEHGGSVRTLAEHFGVGVATISRALNAAND